jgi:hypothetical protein
MGLYGICILWPRTLVGSYTQVPPQKDSHSKELTVFRFEEAESSTLVNAEPEKVWIFGDKILAPKFANDMIYAIFEKHQDFVDGRLQPHVAE